MVSYSRPFSGNRGTLLRTHFLPVKGIVPKELRPLHRYLLSLRMQLFAHTDLARREPKVTRWRAKGRIQSPMTFLALDFRQLDQRTPEITVLVATAETALNQRIAELDAQA